RCGSIELPRACLVQEILGEERTHRAEIDDVRSPRVRKILSFEFSNECAIPALAHVQNRVVRDIVHEAHASCAENAAVGDVKNVAAKIFYRIEALRISIAGVC